MRLKKIDVKLSQPTEVVATRGGGPVFVRGALRSGSVKRRQARVCTQRRRVAILF